VKECANCLLHGWKQPQNKDDLQKCKRCKVIKYCGKECQTEHWQNLHKRQCRYFADPTLAQESQHNESTCILCLQAASLDKRELRNPANPNYFCLYKTPEWEQFMWEQLEIPDLYHPHPFPVTGQPGNTREKLIIVLWRLAYKFKQSQPEVIPNFQDEMKKMTFGLLFQRLHIWKLRKIYVRPEYFPDDHNHSASLPDPHFWWTVKTIMQCGTFQDPLQLCKTIILVDQMLLHEGMLKMMSFLKDPLTSLPREFRHLVSRRLENKNKFLAVVNQVLDALVSRVVPYQDILKIICGGSLKQVCNSCSKDILITGLPGVLDQDGPIVFCDSLYTGVFICGDKNCRTKMQVPMIEEQLRFGNAMTSSVLERKSHQCDFCFLLSPAGDVHRCSRCCTKMYCSKSCQLQDWKIHQLVCEEDPVERKKKLGMEGRREQSREARESFKDHFLGEEKVNEACEMLEKFELKKEQRKAKK